MPSIIHSLKKPQSLGRIGYQYNLHYSSLQYIHSVSGKCICQIYVTIIIPTV